MHITTMMGIYTVKIIKIFKSLVKCGNSNVYFRLKVLHEKIEMKKLHDIENIIFIRY